MRNSLTFKAMAELPMPPAAYPPLLCRAERRLCGRMPQPQGNGEFPAEGW